MRSNRISLNISPPFVADDPEPPHFLISKHQFAKSLKKKYANSFSIYVTGLSTNKKNQNNSRFVIFFNTSRKYQKQFADACSRSRMCSQKIYPMDSLHVDLRISILILLKALFRRNVDCIAYQIGNMRNYGSSCRNSWTRDSYNLALHLGVPPSSFYPRRTELFECVWTIVLLTNSPLRTVTRYRALTKYSTD